MMNLIMTTFFLMHGKIAARTRFKDRFLSGHAQRTNNQDGLIKHDIWMHAMTRNTTSIKKIEP